MKKLVLTLVLTAGPTLWGCSGADLEKLKAENAQLRKQLADEREKATKDLERLKKDSEAAVTAAVQEKGRLSSLLEKKDPELTRTLGDLTKAKSEKTTVEGQLTEMRREYASLRTELNELKKGKAEGEKSLKQAQDAADKLNAEIKSARDTFAKQQFQAEQSIATLTKEVTALKAKLQEQALSPVVDLKPELFTKSKSLIIGFHPRKEKEAELVCKALGFEDLKVMGSNDKKWIDCKWTTPVTDETLKVLNAYRSVIRYVQPDFPAKINGAVGGVRSSELAQTHTPATGTQRGRTKEIDDEFLRSRWNLQNINAPTAWRALGPAPAAGPVIVAVIDYGVDPEHDDLRGYVNRGCHFYGGQVADDDVMPGNPLIRRDDDTNKKLAHGTHIAGIIAAVVNKRNGPKDNILRIMPLKINGLRDVVAAINYAKENGASIISLSVGFRASETGYNHGHLEQAVRDATDSGILLVCAVGNEAADLDNIRNFTSPACYGRAYPGIGDRNTGDPIPDPRSFNVDRILTVSAVTRSGKRSGFSNYGTVTVDLAAPGGFGRKLAGDNEPDFDLSKYNPEEEILSTIPISRLNTESWEQLLCKGTRAKYACLCGTSQAAPHVAGAAALLWAHKDLLWPGATDVRAEHIKSELVRNARKNGGALIAAAGDMGIGSREPQRSEPTLDLSFIDMLRRRTRENPYASRLVGRGMHLFWAKQYRDAIVYFEKAASILTDDAVPYYFMAFSYACMGDKKSASRDLMIALEKERALPVRNWGELVERMQGANRKIIEKVRESYLAYGERDPVGEELWSAWDCSSKVETAVTPLPLTWSYKSPFPRHCPCCAEVGMGAR